MSFYGVDVDGTVAGVTSRAAVSDSVFSGNFGGATVYAAVPTSVASISIVRSTFSNNNYHIYSQGAGGASRMSIASNLFTGATNAAFAQTGVDSTIESRGDNVSYDNAAGLGSVTPLSGL
jgi:hypothetical protein